MLTASLYFRRKKAIYKKFNAYPVASWIVGYALCFLKKPCGDCGNDDQSSEEDLQETIDFWKYYNRVQ